MDQKALFYKIVAFTAAIHRVTHELTKEAKSTKLTPLQYKILEYIAVDQPVTLSQISDCLHISMPNTSRELKKLSTFIEKTENKEDRRKQSIHLSKAGEAMMAVVFQAIETQFRKRIQTVSKEELVEIDHALDVLSDKLFY
ncbi:DNA-binding transcriptional regulator, MarR family [Evansella caseinilytica]|uniref:DNA-binding transcriptional regulator, MarR family n=1 Tax=Evansella caseinilytica TaxID=1503961 RepID=A0A1H3RLK1_9BACI|nr:helix-turn-helix domain-containing protein [Evansella caseinilytica]SDZ26098.1 DNA-binding transcriptional regulator, MarR family [Evansella caseinilytica]